MESLFANILFVNYFFPCYNYSGFDSTSDGQLFIYVFESWLLTSFIFQLIVFIISIVSTFKESLKLLENLPQFKVAKSKEESKFKDDYFQELFDLEHIIPPDYNHETEKHYLGLVENKDSGKVFTNISEYLLTHEKHNPNNISFWFKVGLDFYESKAPELIDRHLLLLALFYSANQKITTAETIYKSVLTKMKKDDWYQKALGLNMYGRMLLKHPKRKEQGMVYIQQSEEIMSILPHWYDKIDNIFLLNED